MHLKEAKEKGKMERFICENEKKYGSYELARCIVEGIKQDRLPLAKFIKDDFKGFDPAHPDPLAAFCMPVSPRYSRVKPLGNSIERTQEFAA